MILVVILYALFGYSFVLSKLLLEYAGPFFATGLRMTAGGIVLLAYIFFSKNISCYPRREDLKYYLQYAILGIFLPYVLRLWAQQYIPSVKASFLFTLSPFFTAIMAYFFNKEKVSLLQFFGLLIGFFGMLPILITGSDLEGSITSIGIISYPELAVILSVASISYALIVMQHMVKDRKCPPSLANGLSMLIGGSLALTGSIMVEPHLLRGNTTNSIIMLCGIMGFQVLLSNVLCANLRAHLLTTYSSTFMAFAAFLTPLFTSIYGWLMFGEIISWHFFVSFCIVISGLTLYYHGDSIKDQLTDPNL